MWRIVFPADAGMSISRLTATKGASTGIATRRQSANVIHCAFVVGLLSFLYLSAVYGTPLTNLKPDYGYSVATSVLPSSLTAANVPFSISRQIAGPPL